MEQASFEGTRETTRTSSLAARATRSITIAAAFMPSGAARIVEDTGGGKGATLQLAEQGPANIVLIVNGSRLFSFDPRKGQFEEIKATED